MLSTMAPTISWLRSDGPLKTGNCQVSWSINNECISLKGVTGPLPNPPLLALVVDHWLGCPIQKCPACLQWTATGFGFLNF